MYSSFCVSWPIIGTMLSYRRWRVSGMQYSLFPMVTVWQQGSTWFLLKITSNSRWFSKAMSYNDCAVDSNDLILSF